MNTPTPVSTAPASGPSGATITVGSLVAGVISYVTSWIAGKYHLPLEIVSGLLGLASAAGMSWLHKTFPSLPT